MLAPVEGEVLYHRPTLACIHLPINLSASLRKEYAANPGISAAYTRRTFMPANVCHALRTCFGTHSRIPRCVV